MRILVIAAALCIGVGKPATTNAGDNQQDVRAVTGWEAVGRLTMANRAMCTGALIASDMVLTAAHCLYDPYTGRSVDPSKIRFEAGLAGGKAKASRMVIRSIEHPGYHHNTNGPNNASVDIALLELASPIRERNIQPFSTDTRPNTGDALGVISYTLAQRDSPLLQHPCMVLARKGDTLVMNCEVDFGASGAPVFAVQGGLRPRLVSVISSKAAMGNRTVSVGTILDRALKVLLRRAG